MAEASGDSFEQLETPMFTVGKSDAILQVLPTALRFWEKLGLGPRGGKKNVTAFALFEDNGEERQLQVEHWLGNMSSTYTVST
jgi:mediator of RNA polymerase II transcription subunit 13